MSNINVSLDNPYGHVTIPRAKIHTDGISTVIANPAVVNSDNPYGSSSAPPPYTVKEEEPEELRCRGCCYSCRKKK